MMGQSAALPAAPNGFDRHHFQGPQAGIASIIQQHRDVLIKALREIEADADVGVGVGIGELDPRNAADHVGTECHGLVQQLRRARFADEPVLGEGDDLDIDDTAEFIADANKRLDAFKPGLGVDIGEGADVERAVERRQRHRAPGVVDDPGTPRISP